MTDITEKHDRFSQQLRDAANARKQSVTGIFVFVILGLLAVMSTLLVLLSAQMYRGTVASAEKTGEYRILTSYVRSMVRGMDRMDGIRVETWTDESTGESCPVISLLESIDGEEYQTQLYVWEGMLRERFTEAIWEFDPEDGEEICPADRMEATLDASGLLTVVLEANGKSQEVCIALRCSQV